MRREEVLDLLQKYVTRYRITKGKGFRLKEFDPGDTCSLQIDRKGRGHGPPPSRTAWLAEEQDMLYAQDRWSLLLVFQAMDAAGKNGTINHVMSGVNPQGCQVFSFKQPSSEEVAHDFMWRYARRLPERGRIGIFNRSYYEEVLVVRVHPELLERGSWPSRSSASGSGRAARRHRAFRGLLRPAGHENSEVLPSRVQEQKKRFMERLEEPEKNWKFFGFRRGGTQVLERIHHAFEDAIAATASKHAPWIVVPADNKWFSRLLVAAAIVEAMVSLDLAYPKVDAAKKKALAAAGLALSRER